MHIVYFLHGRDGTAFGAIAFRIGDNMAAVERHLADALQMLVRLLLEDCER